MKCIHAVIVLCLGSASAQLQTTVDVYGNSGAFQNPDFPQYSKDLLYYLYRGHFVSSDTQLVRVFMNYDLYGLMPSCSDYIRLLNQNTSRCGKTSSAITDQFYQTGGVLQMVAYSNSRNKWNVTYEVIGVLDVYGNAGSFLSPNFPNNYWNDLDLLYTAHLTTPGPQHVQINVDCQFEFYQVYTTCYDYIIFPPQTTRYCGVRSFTMSMVVDGDKLQMRFYTDFSVVSTGFNVTYHVIEPVETVSSWQLSASQMYNSYSTQTGAADGGNEIFTSLTPNPSITDFTDATPRTAYFTDFTATSQFTGVKDLLDTTQLTYPMLTSQFTDVEDLTDTSQFTGVKDLPDTTQLTYPTLTSQFTDVEDLTDTSQFTGVRDLPDTTKLTYPMLTTQFGSVTGVTPSPSLTCIVGMSDSAVTSTTTTGTSPGLASLNSCHPLGSTELTAVLVTSTLTSQDEGLSFDVLFGDDAPTSSTLRDVIATTWTLTDDVIPTSWTLTDDVTATSWAVTDDFATTSWPFSDVVATSSYTTAGDVSDTEKKGNSPSAGVPWTPSTANPSRPASNAYVFEYESTQLTNSGDASSASSSDVTVATIYTAGTSEDTAPVTSGTSENTAPVTSGTSENTAPVTNGTSEDTAPVTNGTSENTAPVTNGTSEDTAPVTNGTSENTAPVTNGTSEDTAPVTNGTSENTAPVTNGTSEDTAPVTNGTSENTAPVTNGTSEDTAPVTNGTSEDTAPVTNGTSENTAPVTNGTSEDTAPVTNGTSENTAPVTNGTSENTAPVTNGQPEKTTPSSSSEQPADVSAASDETTQSTRAPVVVPAGLKHCRCQVTTAPDASPRQVDEALEDERDKKAEKIVAELLVDKNDMSSTKRKHISAHDGRYSAAMVGVVGVVLCALPVVFVLLLDFAGLAARATCQGRSAKARSAKPLL